MRPTRYAEGIPMGRLKGGSLRRHRLIRTSNDRRQAREAAVATGRERPAGSADDSGRCDMPSVALAQMN